MSGLIHPAAAAAAVLARWYAANSFIRRLWAIEEIEAIRIVVTLEPTNDGDDTLPAWLARSGAWARDLQGRMHRTVYLQMISDASHIESVRGTDSALITELCWRDPTPHSGY